MVSFELEKYIIHFKLYYNIMINYVSQTKMSRWTIYFSYGLYKVGYCKSFWRGRNTAQLLNNNTAERNIPLNYNNRPFVGGGKANINSSRGAWQLFIWSIWMLLTEQTSGHVTTWRRGTLVTLCLIRMSDNIYQPFEQSALCDCDKRGGARLVAVGLQHHYCIDKNL